MLIYLAILLLFIVDRLSKLVFFINPSGAQSLGGFISFSLNPHLAFSWPLWPWLFYPLALVILLLLFHYAYQSIKHKDILAWPWSLIIIGAISNLLDRLYYGGVIDFLSWPHFFVFNLADGYITVGIVWLIFANFRKNKKI